MDEVVGLWGLRDKSFLKQSAKILNQTKEPFYSFIVTLSSHYPYDDFVDDSFVKGTIYEDTLLGNYFNAINYVDGAVGEFIKNLEASGLIKDSIIVIYGDHDGIKKKDDYLMLLNCF